MHKSELHRIMVKNGSKAPPSPLVLRLRVAQQKSSKEKMARIKQLEYQLAKKDKQLKLQKAEFDRQLAAKDAANKDLLRSNQKLETELQKRNSGFHNLLQLYWDQETQQQQSKKNNEKLHEILQSQSA